MIEVDALRFAYRRGHQELFDGLSWSFSDGSVTAITGPSGTGKSSLLYLLGLMLTPSAGQIRIDTQPVSMLPDDQRSALRAAHIGFVFQDAALDLTRSVRDNVTEGALYAGISPAVADDRAQQLLDRFGVGLRTDHRPGQISGGQAQRVALCRALVKHPSVVLADEPTGNLDRDSGNEVITALVEAAADGVTVIIASHDPRVVDRCDHVLTL